MKLSFLYAKINFLTTKFITWRGFHSNHARYTIFQKQSINSLSFIKSWTQNFLLYKEIDG